MTMGDRIKQLRKQKGITQTELGRVIGVQQSAIRKYECGEVDNIPRSSIQKMANYFGVSPSYLMGWEDDSSPTITERDIQVALFGGDEEVTDEMWEEVKSFAEFVKSKNKGK